MGIVSEDAIKQFQALMEEADEPFKKTFQKPILPTDLYRGVRDSQLVGLSGYTNEGLPVFAIGVGLSTFDKASVHYYVQSHIQINEYRDRVVMPKVSKEYGRYIGTCVKVLDMTGLKISALSLVKLLTAISTIDDLNYPEKTDTYFIVNVPYIFSACWKVVKPLLQERTRNKILVLQGCGKNELLKIMDLESLPHFCRREGTGSFSSLGSFGSLRNWSNGSHSSSGTYSNDNCFSLDHVFHQDLYKYVKDQSMSSEPKSPINKQGSFHVTFPDPDPERTIIAKTIESEFHKLEDHNGISQAVNGLKVGTN
ncbi:hypothetical protein GIB67_001040 [Kingdonia uniflora]|uniref:CRAL-TRIO domain-containing protein n=1 Tax=Kingdonia uniflora TaxID=39325 RepID=A0A7J7MG16_9MAGN|nr:hypothetical protein GIB67_001040 [Kingdonia uniflora]